MLMFWVLRNTNGSIYLFKQVTFANTDEGYFRYWNKKCKAGRE
jgi:hypothetical protein